MSRQIKYTVTYSFQNGQQTISDKTCVPLTWNQAQKIAKGMAKDGMKVAIVVCR